MVTLEPDASSLTAALAALLDDKARREWLGGAWPALRDQELRRAAVQARIAQLVNCAGRDGAKSMSDPLAKQESLVSVLILARNEAIHIERAVASARRLTPHVFVADSASSDGTADIARAAGAQVVLLYSIASPTN
jgi:hypothetical protein